MIYYDKKSYEEHRDAIVKFLKLFHIGLIVVALTGCYNAAMMRVSGEARDTCQADSDCPADYMCVRNISPDSVLGECVHMDNYDPWANRRLENIIKLENKPKEKSNDDIPEAENPDSRWWFPPAKDEK